VHGGGGSSSPFVGGGGRPSSPFVSLHWVCSLPLVGGPSLSFMLLCCLSIFAVHCFVATLLSVTWHMGIGGQGGCLL